MSLISAGKLKKLVFWLSAVFVLCHFSIFLYGYKQVTKASSLELINLSVTSSFSFTDTDVVPFAFRTFFARREIERRSIEDIKSGVGGVKLVYWVLGFDIYDTEKNRRAKKTLIGISDSLLARGMNIDERDTSGCTSLHHAIINRDIEGVKFLLERGASIQVDYPSLNQLCASSTDDLLKKYLPEADLMELIGFRTEVFDTAKSSK